VQRCQLDGKGGPRFGLICDLSVLGLYVALDPVPELHETFTLCFALLTDDLPVMVDAVVTWRNPAQGHKIDELPPGCGLRFVGLDSKDLKRIQGLVTACALGSPKADRTN
jgi:hypothetical protein